YFPAGTRVDERATKFAAEIADLVRTHGGGNNRLAVDVIPPAGSTALVAEGLVLTDGMAVMERARAVKGPDELAAMRCSIEATRISCQKMFETMEPGMTEQALWAVLWAEMLARGGEWMECRLLVSGPRTNPWFQECSSRVVENGDFVAFDTDLVGAYGMMTDISRTWICGDAAPTPQQRHVHELAVEQVTRNIDLLTPGRTFRELTHGAWMPPVDEYRHYSCLYHGVGQCDEWPDIKFPADWDAGGYDGVLEAGMVLTVESYVGAYAGGQGIKLENQVLVTDTGPENLSPWSLALDSFHTL
ncbi:MAG TPA: Xaa-Pro peptidase family protein, partial [Acidimicrobiales bacterium]|nr:Xaa-Pro peptidase family protein [Acidimicrobiales bacterium]